MEGRIRFGVIVKVCLTKSILYVDFWTFDFKFYHYLHYYLEILKLKFFEI